MVEMTLGQDGTTGIPRQAIRETQWHGGPRDRPSHASMVVKQFEMLTTTCANSVMALIMGSAVEADGQSLSLCSNRRPQILASLILD
ncbi:hypothetical protein GUJ93_ZPchr0012g20922 [Zizania palustris]|uniref:Uncharacterized protein n=1 Tax=Zizania palustris TaxID=103762 RepID=A0A8J5WNJ5_ZIZPA|nr:hypothetical protein GUJ93_ZPchr0012g20922 [Zizania palustris]